MRERQKLWLPNVYDEIDLSNPVSDHDLNRQLDNWYISGLLSSNEWHDLAGKSKGVFTLLNAQNFQPTDRPQAVGGEHLDFPAPDNAMVEFPGAGEFSAGNTFSFSFWYRPRTVTGSTAFFSTRQFGEAAGYYTRIRDTGNEVQFYINDTRVIAWPLVITLGQWYHWAFTCAGTGLDTCRIYQDAVDGTFLGTTVPGLIAGSNDLRFGLSPWDSWDADGDLDDVRIYSRALSANEVTAIYQESLAGHPNTLNRTSSFVPLVVSAAPPSQELDGESGAFSVTGQDAELLRGYQLSAESGVFALTGQDANFQLGRQLVGEAEAFTITGQDANLVSGKQLSAEPTSFSLIGQDADLVTQLQLVAEQGVFLLTGQDAALEEGEALNANHGVFALAGADTALQWNRQLEADGGSFTLTGQDSNLVAGEQLSAESGSFALTGQDAALAWGRLLLADNAIFLLAGQDANLVSGQQLTAEPAAFAFSGQDAFFERAYQLLADAGSFTLTGRDAFLEYSEAPPPTQRVMFVAAEPRIGRVPKEDRTIRVPKE